MGIFDDFWTFVELLSVVLKSPPESLHQLRSHWLNMVIEEVWLKVVHTKFKSSETLANEGLGAIECWYKGVHQHVKVGEEGAGGKEW